jgi:nucleoside-diphosphate kinase
MKPENTVVIIKHDGVARGLMGEVIKRFEKVGLKLVAMEFLQGTADMGEAHYPRTKEWLTKVGNRTLEEYKQKDIDPNVKFGTDDAVEIGKIIKKWNIEYLTYGPVLAMIWQGPDAVLTVRKLVGETNPSKAQPGTIRGDFCVDNAEIANHYDRPIYNLIHASGTVEEAEQEIQLWFGKQEIFEYEAYKDHFLGLKGKL